MIKRLEYFDFLRGIAIIGVIAIHTFKAPEDMNTFDFSCFMRQIINCSVPIFLFISGYFMATKRVKDRQEHFLLVKKQAIRIYIPMLFFSIPYLILSILNGGSIWKGLIVAFVGGYSIYYFIPLIMQYYFILPLLQRFATIKGVFISLLITILSVLTVSYIHFILKMSLPLIVYAGPFVTWLVFFITGVYFGKNTICRKGILYNKLLWVTVLIISLCASYYESQCISDLMGKASGLGIKSSAHIYSFSVVILAYLFKDNYISTSLSRFVVKIGDISFPIYLIHIFVIMILTKFIPDVYSLNWVLRIVLVLSISTLLIRLSMYALPKTSKKILGV